MTSRSRVKNVAKWLTYSPLLMLSSPLMADVIVPPGDSEVVGPGTPAQEYILRDNATLTATGGATLTSIDAGSGATVNLANSTVEGGTGVYLNGSIANISASTLSSNRTALVMADNLDTSSSAQAFISDSTLTGARGASVEGQSTLNLSNSTVTGQTGLGLEMFHGIVNASQSRIVGATSGIRLRNNLSSAGTSVLNLNGTHVEGLNGAAITTIALSGYKTDATILVENGSTLKGSNGVMLEVTDGSTVNMTVDNSALVGDVTVSAEGAAQLTLQNFATLTGRLENVASLNLNSQAQWVMVENSQVSDLAMNGGSVKFGGASDFYTLSLGNLSGNGTFVMDADFVQGNTDFLEVTGTATGNHSLQVTSSGGDPLANTNLQVIHVEAGDAQFSLTNGRVDLGTYSYDLVQQGNDWYLAATRNITPATSSVLGLFNAGPTVWYGELSSLRSRMGEIRLDQGNTGLWARSYGNKYDVSASAGLAYSQIQQGISFGADAPLPFGDDRWLVGLMGGYSTSDLDFQRGTSATVKSYYVGAYTTWIDASGYYFDGVVKLNRFKNESKVGMSDGQRVKGDYDNTGVGASLEFGRHIKLQNNYFVEPFIQLSTVAIQGKDYTLKNGMQADGDTTRSLLGKLGATAGRNFDLGKGQTIQPYVRAAYVHEFAKNNDVEVNNNAFNNDLSGARGELGMGVAMTITDSVNIHADVDYSNGDKIDQPWGANVGIRYTW